MDDCCLSVPFSRAVHLFQMDAVKAEDRFCRFFRGESEMRRCRDQKGRYKGKVGLSLQGGMYSHISQNGRVRGAF